MKNEKLIVKKKTRAKKKRVRAVPPLSPIDLKALLEAGCHFGHRIAKTHPRSLPYLYAKRGGVQIFDLIKTAQFLDKARRFLFEMACGGEKILLVGTKRQAKKIIRKVALEAKMPFVHSRWLGGTLTNWEQIEKRIRRLKKLSEQIEEGVFKERTKREQSLLKKENADLKEKFGGLCLLKKPPAALFLIDIQREKIALAEARTMGIPTVAITDSNTDPDLVDYPIPANDDAKKSIELIMEIIGEALVKGRQISALKKGERDEE